MAQRTPKPAGGRGAQPARAAAKSKKATTVGVEVVEEAPGIGIDAGIAILTSIILVAAIVLVDMMQAKNGDSLFM
jgi:hypothetical protein